MDLTIAREIFYFYEKYGIDHNNIFIYSYNL